MKVQFWVTIAAASALWGPACVLAQVPHGFHGGHGIHGALELRGFRGFQGVQEFRGFRGFQGVHGRLPLLMPQISVKRLPDAGSFFPHHLDPAVPNRRIPSLAPPQSGDIHPVTPDKAWPMPTSIKPASPFVRSGKGNIANDDAILGRGPLNIEGPFDGIGGASGLLR